MIARNITKSYQDKVVFKDRTFFIEEGATTLLLGPSGSGKTTLLRLLSGLEKPDSGDLSDFEKKRFAMVVQEDRLCMNLSSSANVRLVCNEEKADMLLSKLGLGEWLIKPVKYLSGGMRRRVALARALASPCDVLLLDEPFTGLDEKTKSTAIRVLCEETKGKTIILVTHDKEDGSLMGDVRMVNL